MEAVGQAPRRCPFPNPAAVVAAPPPRPSPQASPAGRLLWSPDKGPLSWAWRCLAWPGLEGEGRLPSPARPSSPVSVCVYWSGGAAWSLSLSLSLCLPVSHVLCLHDLPPLISELVAPVLSLSYSVSVSVSPCLSLVLSLHPSLSLGGRSPHPHLRNSHPLDPGSGLGAELRGRGVRKERRRQKRER